MDAVKILPAKVVCDGRAADEPHHGTSRIPKIVWFKETGLR